MAEFVLHEACVNSKTDIAKGSKDKNLITRIESEIHHGNFDMRGLDVYAVWTVLNKFLRDFDSPAISAEIEQNLFDAGKCFQHGSCTYFCLRVVNNSTFYGQTS